MGNNPSTADFKAGVVGPCKDWRGGCRCYQCMSYSKLKGIQRNREDIEIE
jgi:hypothetical protein